MARKPTPIGLIGVTLAIRRSIIARSRRHRRRWRFAKVAMALVVPAGVAFAAHRISEPEGLETAEQPASALEYVTTPDSVTMARDAAMRPPARTSPTGRRSQQRRARSRGAAQ